MKKIKDSFRIMVALDLSNMDKIVLNYVSYLSQIWNVEHIDFIHNIKQSELHNVFDDFVEENIQLENIIERELTRVVQNNYTGSVKYEIHVASDNYTESILSYFAKENKIDLAILGKKSDLQGTGGVSLKLVNMLDCHMMLVPEEVENNLEYILLPTDFTANSAKSFQMALYLKEQQDCHLEALHVFNIPQVYFPYIDRQKAIDKTQEHLERRFATFARRFKFTDIPFKHFYRQDLSVVDSIRKHAREENADMIIMSAKGGNKLTSLFIGSITKDMLLQDFRMPVMVVR
ncbi:MAG TPA: universal stress protein [Flavobacteriaceae bacterium]|nr:universal stress protein [Flavobacteriaceae bacterium]